MPREFYGEASAITVSVIWGLSFVAARITLRVLPPILLAALRFLIASLIFLPLILRGLIQGLSPSRGEFVKLSFLSLLGVSIYFWLQYTGVRYAGAGISALLVVGLIPLLTGVSSSLLLGEGFGPRRVGGVLLGLLGVALITHPRLQPEASSLFYLGILCLLLNALCWSLYSTLSRRLLRSMGRPHLLAAYITLLGTLGLLPLSLTSDWRLVHLLGPREWTCILYLSIICSGVGYLLWSFALSRVEAVRAAIWLYVEPLAAFIGEALLLGVVPKPSTIFGGILILLGAWLADRRG
jgi:drug/metabolite transporter (DMT)-like permease